jgi:hypothetical protein
VSDSPGVRLAYRLPRSDHAPWKALLAGSLSLGWNVTAAVILVLAVEHVSAGRTAWALFGCLLAFAGLGSWSVAAYVREVFRRLGVGPTIVEVARHPLAPGVRCELVLWQGGWRTFRRLGLYLVCEEEATFRDGTDVRTERAEVFRQPIFEATDVEIEPAAVFERRVSFALPNDAMHSFQSPSNAVRWRLVVEGEAEGWPPCRRCFPLIVQPRTQAPADLPAIVPAPIWSMLGSAAAPLALPTSLPVLPAPPSDAQEAV